MSVTDEELMAYADGELSQADAARVLAAVAADPVLAARLDADARLRAVLRGELGPVAAEPVPESLTLMIAAAAAEDTEEDMIDAPVSESARVADISTARIRRTAAAPPPRSVGPAMLRRWGSGFAVAASLVLGLMLGMQVQRGNVIERDGALLASGPLARTLDAQLAASAQGDLRILLSFRRDGGDYCRVYAAAAMSGIACKDEGRWVLERTVGGAGAASGEYRQAGSAQGELMAAAQGMAAGEPLDAAQERDARARGWLK